MKYWNTLLKNMSEYIPGEQPVDINEYIKLNTNENPFPPSEAVLKALRDACAGSLRRYPDPLANEVREIFASQNGLNKYNIFAGNGSDEIFTLIFRGFIEKNGAAAFPFPSYPLYSTLAEGSGIKYETVDLENNFEYNMDHFLKKKCDLVIISNPNNPTGTYCAVNKIRAFLEKFKGLLVVDEAYIDFYGGSAIGLVNEFDNVIITRSLSKSYSLAGLRVGFAAGDRELINGLMKIKDSYNVDSLALAGAKAALLDKKSFNYNIEMVRNNKEYLEESMESMGFEIVPSKANFIYVRHGNCPSKEMYEKLKDKKILIRYFSGRGRSEYTRISVGTMLEIKSLCSALQVIVGT